MGKATRLTVTKSGNGAQLTPAYLSVPLRGGWHLKTVLPNTLVLAGALLSISVAACRCKVSRAFSRRGQKQTNSFHLQQTKNAALITAQVLWT